MRALLAGVQLEAALRTLGDGFGDKRQQRPALSATRDRVRPRHV